MTPINQLVGALDLMFLPTDTVPNKPVVELSLEPVDYLIELSSSLGLRSDYVQLVSGAVSGNNINHDKQTDYARILLTLSAELESATKIYFGGSKTDDLVYDELVLFVLDRFGHLSVGEIRESFSLAASGQFDLDLSVYYGIFTVSLLGKILAAYTNYRNRVVSALMNQQRERETLEALRYKSENFDWALWSENRLSFLRSLESPTYRSVSIFDFQHFKESGVFTYSDEQKKSAWVDSHVFVMAELTEFAPESVTARQMLRKISAGIFEGGYMAKRVCIAQQLLFCRWIFPNFEHSKTAIDSDL